MVYNSSYAILKVHGVEVLSFILGDSSYPIRPYLIKNYSSKNAIE
jgi:hypothetical protein